MFHARIPRFIWTEAFHTAVFLINRLPTDLLHGKTPFESLYDASTYYWEAQLMFMCFPGSEINSHRSVLSAYFLNMTIVPRDTDVIIVNLRE